MRKRNEIGKRMLSTITFAFSKCTIDVWRPKMKREREIERERGFID